MKLALSVALSILLISPLALRAQEKVTSSAWKTVETEISNKHNLEDALVRVNGLLAQSEQAGDQAGIARGFCGRLRIRDLRTEDTLYFQNFREIDSVLESGAPAPLKMALHILKARRIHGYTTWFSPRHKRALVRSDDPLADYASLGNDALDSLALAQMDLALTLGKPVLDGSAEDFLWLCQDPLVFLFKPVLGDVVYSCRVQLLTSMGVLPSTSGQEWLSLSPDAFLQLPDTFPGFSVFGKMVWRGYKQWINFHAEKGEQEPVYYIETLAHKFMYQVGWQDSARMTWYGRYLEDLLTSPYPSVRVHGVYQLCMLWNHMGASYNQTGKNVYDYGVTGRKSSFDSSYRLYYSKVMDLFQANTLLLDSFPFIRRMLEYVAHDILVPKATLHLNQVQQPGQPMLAKLTFRNAPRFHARLVRISQPSRTGASGLPGLNQLLQQPAYRTITQSLPTSDDYQSHNVYLKFDSLPVGKYALLYWVADTLPAPGSSLIDAVELDVTSIAAVFNGERLYVVDRFTGFPLAGATVTDEKRMRKVNGEGFVPWTNDEAVLIAYRGDTLVKEIDHYTPRLDNEGETDERGLDYYEENTRLYVYTDRGIYRPGQKVYYKGIFMTTDPVTGNKVLLNRHNLRLPPFEKLMYRMKAKWEKEKVGILVHDPFNKVVDSIRVRPNAYGSFADSLFIPASAPTGAWSFDVDERSEIRAEESAGFEVEEYKRPTFTLTIGQPERALLPGDTFSVKVSAVSFAGAPLERVRLHYTVSRTAYWGKEDLGGGELAAGDALTDSRGTFRVPVRDSLHFLGDDEVRANYEIQVSATDPTGEHHEGNRQVSLTNRPITLTANIPQQIDLSKVPTLLISGSDAFVGPIQKPVTLSIFRETEDTASIGKDRRWIWATDQRLYDLAQLRTWFPHILFPGMEQEEREEKVYVTEDSTGGRFTFPPSILLPGKYRLVLTCREAGFLRGERSYPFTVFDRAAPVFPGEDFSYLPFNQVKQGASLSWTTGHKAGPVYSIYSLSWLRAGEKGIRYQHTYLASKEAGGLYERTFLLPRDVYHQALLTRVYVKDGEIHSVTDHLYIDENLPQPEVVVDQYRSQLVPGARETFEISVRTKDPGTAAELMTTLYDASLDALHANTWTLPENYDRFYLQPSWSYTAARVYEHTLKEPENFAWDLGKGDAIWWMEGSQFDGVGMLDGKAALVDEDILLNRAPPGMQVLAATGLDEVVVVGYSTSRALAGSAVSVRIRGAASLAAAGNGVLVILDGKEYTGAVASLDAQTITDALVLRGADAAALFGARAENGVLVLSTKGPIHLPPPPAAAPPPLVVRKNFAETAFFYPQLYADKDGRYHIHFTLPESVTAWRWQLLAHTKRGGFAYLEKKLVSQLPLMVQPALPRFLYQGDELLFRSRITNLDSSAQSGELRCVVEDEVTGEDLSASLLDSVVRSFRVDSRSTTAGAFRIRVPAHALHPLRIRITARSGEFSDGEEHVLPVLSRQVLVAQEAPLSGSTEVRTPPMPEDAVPYGLSLFAAPPPQAALLNALPSLVDYPLGCAEQTFDKWIAYAVARQLATVEGKPAEDALSAAPEAPGGDVMPWLDLNRSARSHQQRLHRLMDTTLDQTQMEHFADVLKGMQNADGGMTWFPGGRSDFYISCYILAGLGQARQEGLAPGDGVGQPLYEALAPALIRYCDQAVRLKDNTYLRTIYANARTYWLHAYPLDTGELDQVFREWAAHPGGYSLGAGAQLAAAALRYGKAPYPKTALDQLASIHQAAIEDSVHGIRWKELADEEDLSTCAEEWIVRLAEAFEAGQMPAVTDGILRWLLNARSGHEWSTTKATAQAVGLLYRRRKDLLSVPPQVWTARDPSGPVLKVTDGRPYDFDSCYGRAFPPEVTVQTAQPGTAALTYYYFTATPPVSKVSEGLSLSRTLERYDPVKAAWTALSEGDLLHTGDKIRAMLTISTPIRLQYVYITDRRAAALEPADLESGYRYASDLGYYQAIRDAGMGFFADVVPAGLSHLSYEMTVSHEGAFTYGPASLQCMYRPDIQTYSRSTKLMVASNP